MKIKNKNKKQRNYLTCLLVQYIVF